MRKDRYLGEYRLNARERQKVLANFAALGTDAALLVQGDLAPVVLVFGTADRLVVLHDRLTGRESCRNVGLNRPSKRGRPNREIKRRFPYHMGN